MILILNTLCPGSADTLKTELEKRRLEFEILETQSMNISHCIGCNYCWLKTPGVCAIHDDYEIILKKLIHADQLWVISDTSFGFLSHRGKNLFDRIMPIVTMYLHFDKGYMRHIMRYPKKTDVGIIYAGNGNREYLNQWCQRAAVNLGSHSRGAWPVSEIREVAACM